LEEEGKAFEGTYVGIKLKNKKLVLENIFTFVGPVPLH
jgi:hypothetical protein